MTKAFSSLVILGLGSNLGDKSGILRDAVRELEVVLADLRRASVYETKPLYVEDQEVFLNTAVSGFYDGEPWQLLVRIHEIERRFGRDRGAERRWGERRLDIDILTFGDLHGVFPLDENKSALTIPHQRLHERRFALQPLLELSPFALDPVSGVSYRSICDALPDQGVKRIDEQSQSAF